MQKIEYNIEIAVTWSVVHCNISFVVKQ